MTYFQNLNRLILKELEIRAADFAAAYDPGKPSIILIPGGMGSRLLQCHAAYGRTKFSGQPRIYRDLAQLAGNFAGQNRGPGTRCR
jgi:hypothetical protein